MVDTASSDKAKESKGSWGLRWKDPWRFLWDILPVSTEASLCKLALRRKSGANRALLGHLALPGEAYEEKGLGGAFARCPFLMALILLRFLLCRCPFLFLLRQLFLALRAR